MHDRSRGFTLVEVVVALGISVVLGFFLLRATGSLLHWSSLQAQRNTEHASIAQLEDRWDAEERSAWAIFTPNADVNGASNADGHELDFFTRDAKSQSYFWAYNYDAAHHTLTRYLYGSPGGPPTAAQTYSGITKFYAHTYPVTALQDRSSKIYSPLYDGAHLTAGVVRFYGASKPEIAGGNQITYVRIEGPTLIREIELATDTAPSGFTVVLQYTPAPADTPNASPSPGATPPIAMPTPQATAQATAAATPTPTPAPLLVWPAAVRYAISGTQLADTNVIAPRIGMASLFNAMLGGSVAYAAAASCKAMAYPSVTAMTNNQPYAAGTTDPYGAGITIDGNGCYDGSIVLHESGYTKQFLDYGPPGNPCWNTFVKAAAWTPLGASSENGTVSQAFSGGSTGTILCTLGFKDRRQNLVTVNAQVIGCANSVTGPDDGKTYCIFTGDVAAGSCSACGVGAWSQAKVWEYDTVTSTGPVEDCSDGETCLWNQNGAVAFCFQPIQPMLLSPVNIANPIGFACDAQYTTRPPARPWTVIPCQGRFAQCHPHGRDAYNVELHRAN
jgi:type II secretory pathway pseudopilin PulG